MPVGLVAVAQAEGVGFIDLNEKVAARYDALGRDAVMKLFPQVTPDEHNHPNRAGAELNAEFVIAGLKALTPNPLAQYYSAKAAGVEVGRTSVRRRGESRMRKMGRTEVRPAFRRRGLLGFALMLQ